MVTAGAIAIDANGRNHATNGAHAAPFVRVRKARLRHNRGMRPLFLIVMPATALLLGGCESAAPPAGQGGAAVPASSSAMEFRGERPCADCTGIEAWLRLEQEGKAQRYQMIEHYRDDDRERRFDDEGDWRADGNLLRLRSRNGGERVYARLASGALQARDAHGLPLPASADEVMVPVTFDTTR